MTSCRTVAVARISPAAARSDTLAAMWTPIPCTSAFATSISPVCTPDRIARPAEAVRSRNSIEHLRASLGWSNIANRPSPVYLTTLPEYAATELAPARSCSDSVCFHASSPRADATSVDPTMSVMSRVATQRPSDISSDSDGSGAGLSSDSPARLGRPTASSASVIGAWYLGSAYGLMLSHAAVENRG